MEIRSLTEAERAGLQDGLDFAARLLNTEQPLSTADVQILYDVMLNEHFDQTEMLISVGLAFGETIVQQKGYEWVRVAMESGEETALSPIGVKIVCFPISTLEKRLARREAVNIAWLRDALIEAVETRQSSGEFESR